MSAAPEFHSDVLVVGAGPMGATTSLALARLGIRVHMVNRQRWVANSPRAHITNQRAMEVLRDLDVARRVEQFATPWELMGDTLIAASLAGPELARIRTWGTGDERYGDYLRSSPEGMLDVPQPALETALIAAALEQGATAGCSVEYLRHEEDDGGVTTTLLDRLTGRETSWRSRYLVGADGARSKVVETLGLPLEGQMGRATTAYVLFRADLARYVSHRPSILYWLLDADSSFGEIGMGLLRAVRPWEEWIAGWGYDPDEGEPDFSEARVVARIRALVGDPELKPEIVRAYPWQVNEAYATQLSAGRVFCGGDAIHRHPPSGGLGSNTSIQDAHNLAWKLAYVIDGNADPSLLDSYTEERAPVARQVVLRANQLRREFGPLRDVVARFGDAAAAARALGADGSERGTAARAALAAAVDLKNNEFNAHGVEHNHCYRSRAVIADGDEEFRRDPDLYAQPSTSPGAKLPHAWLVGEDGRRISTLDLVGGGTFTLVTGVSGGAWSEAVARLGHPWLRRAVIGAMGARDLYFNWARDSGLEEGAALLVRPDGHIAWRHPAVTDPGEAGELLGVALDVLLGPTV